MYIIQNAMKNLLRNKSRNILIFLILFVTITAVTTCAIIRSTSEKQVDNYVNSFKVRVEMNLNLQKITNDFPPKEIKNIDGTSYYIDNMPSDIGLTLEEIEQYAKSDYVDYVEMNATMEYATDMKVTNSRSSMNDSFTDYYGKDMDYFRNMIEKLYTSTYKYYQSEEFQDTKLYESLYERGHNVTDQEAGELAARSVFGDEYYQQYLESGLNDELVEVAFDMKFEMPGALELCLSHSCDFNGMVIAYGGENSDFKDNVTSISEGRVPESVNECAISKQFAEDNHLSIGDELSLEGTAKSDVGKKLKMVIVGIYSCNTYDYADPDTIYTITDTLLTSGMSFYEEMPIYYLKDRNSVQDFEKELRASGLSDYITIKSNLSELNNIIDSIENIGHFSGILLWVILILGGAVFLLLSFLAVCERKYEIGVLRAIGMKKKNILKGFLVETAAIVAFCCIFGIIVGTLLSQPVAKQMISGQQKNISNTSSDNSKIIGIGNDGSTITNNEVNSDINGISSAENEEIETMQLSTHLTYNVAILMVGIAMLLMIIAVMISGLYITKFEPIKILSEHE